MSELEGALKRTVGEVEVVKGQVERILTALLASREIVRERERPSLLPIPIPIPKNLISFLS